MLLPKTNTKWKKTIAQLPKLSTQRKLSGDWKKVPTELDVEIQISEQKRTEHGIHEMRVAFVKLREKKEPSHKWRANYNMPNFEYVNENLVMGVEKRYEQN